MYRLLLNVSPVGAVCARKAPRSACTVAGTCLWDSQACLAHLCYPPPLKHHYSPLFATQKQWAQGETPSLHDGAAQGETPSQAPFDCGPLQALWPHSPCGARACTGPRCHTLPIWVHAPSAVKLQEQLGGALDERHAARQHSDPGTNITIRTSIHNQC